MLDSRRWLSPAVLVCVWLPLIVGCRPGSSGARPTATPTPRQRLEDASRQMQSVSAFHFLLTHQNGFSTIGNGLDMTRAEGDFVAPERFKAAVKGSFQTLPVSVSVISVQNQTWVTNPLQGGEHYLPLTNGPQTTQILDPSRGLLKAASEMRDPKLTGSDKVGTVET
ncbi:MAG TPA: LppX_LprAFG lipoprotein, partial [Dehalococcoidia bacterium]|nr:LppX_LprAFG lipoprotein [Dehalococcoidia bacterium]